MNYKSGEARGYEVGVVVDPVRLESLASFGTAAEVGEKVFQVETRKDGYLGGELLGSR